MHARTHACTHISHAHAPTPGAGARRDYGPRRDAGRGGYDRGYDRGGGYDRGYDREPMPVRGYGGYADPRYAYDRAAAYDRGGYGGGGYA